MGKCNGHGTCPLVASGTLSIDYQQLVSRLRGGPEPEPGYFAYLADRYGLS